MESRIRKISLVLLSLVILVDLLTIRVINMFLDDPSPVTVKLITGIHWGISFFFMAILLAMVLSPPRLGGAGGGYRAFKFSGWFTLVYFPKLLVVIFQAVDEMLFQTARFMTYRGDPFLIMTWVGLVLGFFALAVIVYGMVAGWHRLQVRHHSPKFKALPRAFHGLRLVHFSDFHLGSLSKTSSYPEKVVTAINELNPDMVLFTGDLVNFSHEEAQSWVPLLKDIRARHGKFAVTGNHDYGSHMDALSQEELKDMQERIKATYSEAGFQLLDNRAVIVERKGQHIAFVGVNNQGSPPFPALGDLETALKDVKYSPFHILLSHDPSHWDEEVVEKTNIGLTLSGHTHGFQMGVNTRRFKWSPAQYMYPRWIGIHQHKSQFLNVSAGCGYIGFPGRMGIPPEISLITPEKQE